MEIRLAWHDDLTNTSWLSWVRLAGCQVWLCDYVTKISLGWAVFPLSRNFLVWHWHPHHSAPSEVRICSSTANSLGSREVEKVRNIVRQIGSLSWLATQLQKCQCYIREMDRCVGQHGTVLPTHMLGYNDYHSFLHMQTSIVVTYFQSFRTSCIIEVTENHC